MHESQDFGGSEDWSIIVKSEAAAAEQPMRLVFFRPGSAEEPERAWAWRVLLVQGGSTETLWITHGYSVFVTCDLFRPDDPEQTLGEFRSEPVALTEPCGRIHVRPVTSKHGDFLGLRLEHEEGTSGKLEIDVSGSLDRPVTLHVQQDGHDLYEVRVLSAGDAIELQTPAEFLTGFQVALTSTRELNAAEMTLLTPAFLTAQEVQAGDTVTVKGGWSSGFSMVKA